MNNLTDHFVDLALFSVCVGIVLMTCTGLVVISDYVSDKPKDQDPVVHMSQIREECLK